MTKDEMQKVVEAFNEVTDHVERAPGLRALARAFPDLREQVLSEAARLESPDDPAWYRSSLEDPE